MNIRTRISDVDRLRSHICQKFFMMVCVSDWKEELDSFLDKECKGKNQNMYTESYSLMRAKGKDCYSAKDMDVSLIVNVLLNCHKISTPLNYRTKRALKDIRDDRNLASHSSDNEPEEILHDRALDSLRSLKKFISNVDIYECQIPDQERSHFIQQYRVELDDLEMKIRNESNALFQIKQDIQSILSSANPIMMFLEFQNVYITRSIASSNYDQLYSFYIAASNAGIPIAHKHAAEHFLITLDDSDEAMHRWELYFSDKTKIDPIDAHYFTDFVNHVYELGKTPTDRILGYVNLIKEQGYEIEITKQGILWK